MNDVIPDSIFQPIQTQLVKVGDRAESGWEGGSDEEDTLTGALGEQLQTEWCAPVRISGVRWRWRIRYKKFRGRGKDAFENVTGADGILQIEVMRGLEGDVVFKGLLFQAKKNGGRGKLLEQVQKMEKVAPGGSVVFVYREEGYLAVEGDAYITPSEDIQDSVEKHLQPLGSFLGKEFLPCNTGVRGMYYDAVRKLLLVPRAEGGIDALPVTMRHRLTIEVESVLE